MRVHNMLNESNKKTVLLVGFAIISLLIVNILYILVYLEVSRLKPMTINESAYEPRPGNLAIIIDNCIIEQGYLKINGIALIVGEQLSTKPDYSGVTFDNRIWMKNINTGEYFEMPTQKIDMASRQLSDWFQTPDIPYDASGFTARAKFSGNIEDYLFYLYYNSNHHNILVPMYNLELGGDYAR